MTDRTSEVSQAFDQARAWDRSDRDARIAVDLDRLNRLSGTIAQAHAARIDSTARARGSA